MALTFAQRRDAVIRGIREARKAYRKADTAGEKLERELDRLILRKRVITVEQLQKMVRLYLAYGDLINAMQPAINNALIISQQALA